MIQSKSSNGELKTTVHERLCVIPGKEAAEMGCSEKWKGDVPYCRARTTGVTELQASPDDVSMPVSELFSQSNEPNWQDAIPISFSFNT